MLRNCGKFLNNLAQIFSYGGPSLAHQVLSRGPRAQIPIHLRYLTRKMFEAQWRVETALSYTVHRQRYNLLKDMSPPVL